MAVISDIDALLALYGEPSVTAVRKETDRLTPLQRTYIEASPFMLVASAGPDGLDCSPRGDPAGFVRVADERTLLIPDRRGNHRLDTLRNILHDPRVGLLFLVPGVGVTLRVNGAAHITTDDALRESFAIRGRTPTTVVVVRTTAVYTQCPKALVRSHLWDPARFRDARDLPSLGQIMEEITAGELDGAQLDREYPERLRTTMY